MSTDTAFALGHAGAGRPALLRPPARVHAHRRRRRRPRSRCVVIATVYAATVVTLGAAAGARVLLPSSCSPAGCRRPRRPRLSSRSAAAAWVSLLKSGVDPVVIGLAMGLLTYARRPRARTWSARPTCSGCSASSRRRSWRATARLGLESAVSPNERLQQLLPPVDELRDRAAVRARQRRDRDRRRLPVERATARRSRSGSSSATWSASRSACSASRGWRRSSAADGCARRSAGRRSPAAGAIAGHRLHRVAADRHARLRRRAARARPSSACSSAAALAALLSWLVFRVTAALPARAARAGAARHRRADHRPGRPRRSRPRPHPRPARRAGDAGRVRRLRVPVLRPGRADRPRAARRLRRRALRLAPPAAARRPPATPSSPPRRRRRPPTQGAFWEMHDLLLEPPGRADARATWSRYAERARPRRRPLPRRSAPPRPAPPASPTTSTAPT